MRIGAAQQSNATYRSFLPCVALEDRGHQLTVLRGDEREIVHQVRQRRFDVAQIYRNYSQQAAGVPGSLLRSGRMSAWACSRAGGSSPTTARTRSSPSLVRDRRARRKLSGAAREWATTQTVDANAWRWQDAFEEAVEIARRRGAGPVDGVAVRV